MAKSNHKKRRYPVTYRRKRVFVERNSPIKKGKCSACHRTVKNGEIKTTQLHHWKYEFSVPKVRKNPELALKNTVELCYGCHQVADAFRKILERSDESLPILISILETMPLDMQRKFSMLCIAWEESGAFDRLLI